ncbi:MAG: DUF3459 domain-containing protein, partial [Cyclonatronaceae bacterium]
IHSLLGTENDRSGVAETGQARSINRKKWNLEELQKKLQRPTSHHARLFRLWKRLLNIRKNEPAFDPQGGKKVMDTPPELFSMWRTSPSGTDRLLIVANVSSEPVVWNAPFRWSRAAELISGKLLHSTELELEPWQIMWIKY